MNDAIPGAAARPVNLGSLLTRQALYHPNQIGVVCGAHRLPFVEVNARVNRLAHALLRLGFRKGEALALMLPNGIELLDAHRACALLGVVAVPLSPMLRGEGLVTLLRDSSSRAVIAFPGAVQALDLARRELGESLGNRCILTAQDGHVDYLDYAALVNEMPSTTPDVPNVSGDDVFNIIYSSGTTGQPKGIVLTHTVRARYATLFAAQFRITPESVVLHTGSLVFNGAFVTMMASWLTGCRYIVHERFDAVAFLETVEREGVTHVMLVPSQIVAIFGAPSFSARKLASIQMFCSVGAPWHRELKEKALEAIPNSCYELHGLTEGFITVLDRSDFAAHMESVGFPIPFGEMRIIDGEGNAVAPGVVGEIICRSPIMMSHYHRQPELTAAALRDGWLHTGDLGMVDDEGFLHLVDRKKDMLISGGVNVYPRDIEEVAARHADVREVAVFGVSSERWGESPMAAVILRDGATVTGEELKLWINARVAARFQELREIVILTDFPRSTAGKTLKRLLREQYA
ncbi:MAG: class I adenylate-forming enzyme family protein, partial [Gemmatimonadaceae bacterium]